MEYITANNATEKLKTSGWRVIIKEGLKAYIGLTEHGLFRKELRNPQMAGKKKTGGGTK